MSFYPQGYKLPQASNHYMKLNDGENKFRMLSKPIVGWEDWDQKKPIRFKMDKKPESSIDPKKPVKHFWAMIVWNYQEEQIQILQLSQATVRSQIDGLINDKDWGSPFDYDLKIIKSGEKTDTEYKVNPLPHKPVSNQIKQAFYDKPCNLEALFINADPFSKEWKEFTQPVFENQEVIVTASKIEMVSEADIYELNQILDSCNPTYKDKIVKFLDSQKEPIHKMPLQVYENIKRKALANKQEYDEFKKQEKIAGF